MQGRWFIYVLRDPRDGGVRYVGKTTDPKRRVRRHVAESVGRSFRNARWIQSLTRLGLAPELEVIESGTGDGHAAAEQSWIEAYRARGANLTNTARGGIGGAGPCTPEAREKNRRSNLGLRRSDETRERVRQSKLGHRQSEATKAKRAAANTGRPHTEERKRRISAAKMGHEVSSETRAKIAASLAGRKPTEETRERLRAAQQARRARERQYGQEGQGRIRGRGDDRS